MFDSFHQHHHDTHVSVSKAVHEHRAPTDASVALLREMESAAKSSVDKAVRVDDMGITCVVHQQKDLMSGLRLFAVIYSLNGKRHRVDWQYDELKAPTHHDALQQIAVGLRDALAVDMASNLLGEPLAKAMQGVQL